jgi:hypothetical protein
MRAAAGVHEIYFSVERMGPTCCGRVAGSPRGGDVIMAAELAPAPSLRQSWHRGAGWWVGLLVREKLRASENLCARNQVNDDNGTLRGRLRDFTPNPGRLTGGKDRPGLRQSQRNWSLQSLQPPKPALILQGGRSNGLGATNSSLRQVYLAGPYLPALTGTRCVRGNCVLRKVGSQETEPLTLVFLNVR